MALGINGTINLICDECGNTDSITMRWKLLDLSTLVRKIASIGWVVLGDDGAVMCRTCNGMTQADIDKSTFDLRLRG